MKQFSEILQLIGETMPDLLSLLLCPALLLAAGVLLAVFRRRKAYLPLAVGLGGAAGFLIVCETGAGREFFAYLAVYTVFAVLVSLLFLIPFCGGKASRADELYEKFHEPLDLPVPAEEEPAYSEEECGLRLDHAVSLVEQLKKCPLTAADRLEVDVLARTLDGYRSRALTEEETRAVNDCLASVLKFTAKYKL